jgi:hypothetical protein
MRLDDYRDAERQAALHLSALRPESREREGMQEV